ncbi:putative bifunctional diguanylate cyclase/phosphodiesterase [Hoeflea sp.]|uniref:putative bifunctional diguanylate cyclase/phosphodiesterase n=1 Tax=Hoeflea sp. TaxID=1940281 RepID=UPI003747DFFA
MLKPAETIVSTEPDLADKAVRSEFSADIIERLDSAVWVFDFDICRVIWANKSALSAWSADSVEDLAARDMSTDMSPAVARRLRHYRTDFLERDDAVFTEVWTVYPKGVPRPMLVRFRGVRLADGRMGMLCEGREETSLLPEAVRSADALLHTQLMISLHASDGETLYSNPAARTAFENHHSNLRARFVYTDDFERLLERVGRDGETSLIAEVQTVNGQRWHELTARSCHDPVSGSPSILLSETDVSGLKEAEALARKRADHDSLTSLPNRMALPVRFEALRRTAKRADARIGVLFIDLDQFKEINDTMGHEQGDVVLKEVARRLDLLCGPDDCAFRLGGDEFLFVALDTGSEPDRVPCLADEILENLSLPIHVDRKPLTVTPSIGIASFPDHGEDAQSLMQRADLAMYAAKSAGRNQYRVFDDSILSERQEELDLLGNLREGLARGEIEAFFQSRVCAETRAIICVEALARWRHPERGLLAPAQFIPLAEKAGLINPLGLSILTQTLAQQCAWAEAGIEVNVSVNLSLRQLCEPEFGNVVAQLLDEYGCPGARLEFEITETLLLEDNPVISANLDQIRSLGVRISIDDFGTGYSNLARLTEMTIDCVKIDRSLIAGLPRNEALVKMVIAMCNLMQVTIVAEGVETEEAAEWAFRNGCQELQGYLFGKPRPGAEVEAILRAQRAASRQSQSDRTSLRRSA